ncbi:S8 family serine peptidase [Pedobacter cryotolerans]|uniref:Peptidase S8 n=1 Tax=Pedobacter cryotolerans TaxID=2571270 RepID=A0A4U1C258_9SPHI|nr:S8 family serine peptidase [Pedobacter cryotolerans]TKB97197.1 peptidase S8 [Pedobacter cryotolerans]
MKKTFLVLLVLINALQLFAQDQTKEKTKLQVKEGSWYKEAPLNGTFGIDLNGAKQLLKTKKILKTPIIALIGTGSDIEHEALKNSVWVNPTEKLDGIDNDKNGFIDDINGWNFLGSKEGQTMEKTVSEIDREWLRLKDKYAEIYFDGKSYFTIENGLRKSAPKPANLSEFVYFDNLKKLSSGSLASKYSSYKFAFLQKEYVEMWDKEIMRKWNGKTRKDIPADSALALFYDKTKAVELDSLKRAVFGMTSMFSQLYKGYMPDKSYVVNWEVVYDNFMNKQIDFSKKNFDDAFKFFGNDQRQALVKDASNDITDNKYGNNILLTATSGFGTLLSGIIAGNDVNGTGFSGIMPEAKIMNLVVAGKSGAPYPKDVALAIKYAVDKGADVIVLSQQSSLFSTEQKTWIYDAIRQAEKKGILVIVPALERREDLDKVVYHPRRENFNGLPFTNLMVIANSDKKGLPSELSSYGKNSLDMFVPGVNVYSTLPGDTYNIVASPSSCVAVAAASAALIKAYFPNLNGTQIRKLLMANVTSRKGLEVEKNFTNGGKAVVDLFLYEQLCTSGGILNLKKTVEAALKTKK